MAKLKCAKHQKRVMFFFRTDGELVVVHRSRGAGTCDLPITLGKDAFKEWDELPGCPPETLTRIRQARREARKIARAARHRRATSGATAPVTA